MTSAVAVLPAVADQSGTAGSRALVMDMVATGVVELAADAQMPAELMRLLRREEISVGVLIPRAGRLHDGG